MATKNFKNPNLTNMDISFDLHRLFDPFNLDHIPESERMNRFPQRNMSHVRHYKAAVKFFGAPHSRRRVIIAPKMETPMRHRLGEYMYMDKKSFADPEILNSPLIKKRDLAALSPVVPKCLSEARIHVEAEKLEEHQKWINERKKLRSDLNNMGLTQAYLERKPDKTEQEKLLMQKMIEDSKPVLTKPRQIVDTHLEADPGKAVPMVKLPSPKALTILDLFMREQKIRLIDLFTSVDKDKNWTISREEFKKAMKIHNVPLSDELIEDLVLALDTDCSDELDYRELSKGMIQFRRERRENKRKEIAYLMETSMSTMSRTPSASSGFTDDKLWQEAIKNQFNVGKQSPQNRPHSRPGHSSRSPDAKQSFLLRSGGKSSPALFHADSQNSSAGRSPLNPMEESSGIGSPDAGRHELEDVQMQRQPLSKVPEVSSTATYDKPKSANACKSSSNSCASTPSQLALPEPDLRPEQFVLGSEEAMVDHIKVTRSILSASAKARKARSDKDIRYPSIIKIGDKAIDNHSMFSQLEGDTGDMMNRFRQEKLREYYAVRALCQERGFHLTKKLLDKVMLHPPDKPHSVILKEMKRKRGTGKGFLSSKFASSQKNTEELPENENENQKKRSKQVKTVNGQMSFPKQKWLGSRGKKVNLSTGRAFIKPTTDCWMTFEEYERHTRHLSAKYRQMHGAADFNAFWPGYMLDKLRLCMPPYDQAHSGSIGSSVLFQNVKQGTRSNFGYNNDLNTFPVDSHGFVKYGDIDPYLRKPIVL